VDSAVHDAETFRTQLDTSFRVDHHAGPVTLRLVEVADEGQP
jgi:hypothetical protein